jgi:hypothetical protein
LIRTALALLTALGTMILPAPRAMSQEAGVTSTTTATAPAQPSDSEKLFLDRLMIAESGGRSDAKNPRSTALGPYQFLGSTFLDVMGRYFPALISGKSDEDVLQLRTDHAIARDAALVYTRENAAFLLGRGVEANAAHLRLAFLVGPTGAQRIVGAQGETPVSQLLGPGALEANPFLRSMTAAELIQRAALEASGVHIVAIPDNFRRPKLAGIRIRCSLARPSCRRWVALAMKRKGKNAPQTTAADAKPEAGKAKE